MIIEGFWKKEKRDTIFIVLAVVITVRSDRKCLLAGCSNRTLSSVSRLSVNAGDGTFPQSGRARAVSHRSRKEIAMGFFSNILEKLGIGSKAAASTSPSTGAPAETGATGAPPPKPVAVVDVVAQLEQRAAANPQKLNWRTSIVDLLKLLEIDSSFAARKELATELGCPAELMGDSAKMNIWLHKTVLAQIAANGGNVPKELLD